jgi:hypothetical protein
MTLIQLWVTFYLGVWHVPHSGVGYLLPGCLTCHSFSCGLPVPWVFEISLIQVWVTSYLSLTCPSFGCGLPILWVFEMSLIQVWVNSYLSVWHVPHSAVAYLFPGCLKCPSFRCEWPLTWVFEMSLIQGWVTSYLGIWHDHYWSEGYLTWHDSHSGVGYTLPGYLTWP